MSKQIEGWLRDKTDTLEKRIDHHRKLGLTLSPDSALNVMNERALLQMELKLFKLRRQLLN